jgi:2-hydroxy-3-keto-5-methylthiopentenyl-1-phosphate phosphatase
MPDYTVKPVVFLDFDGTISRVDVVDALLDRYADPAWQRIESEWKAGRIGSRACLAGQLALVRATRDDVEALLESVDIDPGFLPLLDACARAGIGTHIVSDGFDYCIGRILRQVPASHQAQLARVSVHASHLEPDASGSWKTAFGFMETECEHGCATCKPAVMAALNPGRAPSIFVGDGLSDRYAAAVADVVFAKDALAVYCAEQGIAFHRYESLADVAAFVAGGILRETHEYR